MEMKADGKVGFNELYAGDIVSESVVNAYHGPTGLTVNPSFVGESDSIVRSINDAIKRLNGKYLIGDVVIILPSNVTELYEPNGIYIRGVGGSGHLIILGNAACRLNSHIAIEGCTAHVMLTNLSLREERP